MSIWSKQKRLKQQHDKTNQVPDALEYFIALWLR